MSDNSVLISSWNGQKIKARIGMVVRTYQGDLPITKINEFNNELSCLFNRHDFVFQPEECTVLYTPFQVGDKYQFVCGNVFSGWSNNIIVETQYQADGMNSQKPEFFFRHANRNLRTSPEYKP